jgi:hypothetical protein
MIRRPHSDPLDTALVTHDAEIMRTTLTLDDDVYEAALKMSRASGERLGKVISRLARHGLPRRFPVFDVRSDAPMMTVESIDKFIEEEGLF